MFLFGNVELHGYHTIMIKSYCHPDDNVNPKMTTSAPDDNIHSRGESNSQNLLFFCQQSWSIQCLANEIQPAKSYLKRIQLGVTVQCIYDLNTLKQVKSRSLGTKYSATGQVLQHSRSYQQEQRGSCEQVYFDPDRLQQTSSGLSFVWKSF